MAARMEMLSTYVLAVVLAAGGAAVLSVGGCNGEEDETVGERIDEAVERAEDAAGRVAEEARDRGEHAADKVEEALDDDPDRSSEAPQP